MPDLGICFDTDGLADGEGMADLLVRMLDPHGRGHTLIREVDGRLAAVNLLKPFSRSPSTLIQEPDAWIMVDGFLLSSPGEERPLDRLCLEADRLPGINGRFNAVVYHPAQKRLDVITDRLGFRPLYYGRNGTRHLISSEIKAVLAGLNRPFGFDSLGLLELLAFGHNVGNRTVLQGIELIPPGSIVSIDDEGVRIRSYFKYRYRWEKPEGKPALWGERLAEKARDVIPQYLAGKSRKALFLSGGLDSRFMAGALGREGRGLAAVTFGYPEARDVRYAAALAEILGFDHRILTYPDVYLSKVISDVVARTECATPFYHATSLLFHDAIAEEADEIWVGFCGDVFSGGHLRPAMFDAPPPSALTGLIFQRALCAERKVLEKIFRPGLFNPLWSDLVGSFTASVEGIKDQSAPDTADVWDVENRQRRFTFSAPKVDRGRFDVLAPLLDNGIVDLILTLPPSARRGQIAYKHAIVQGFPHMRTVPWAATGHPVSLHPAVEKAQTLYEAGRKVGRSALSRLGVGKAPMGWQFRNVGEEMRRDGALFEEHLDPFLEGDAFPEELFDREGIKNLVKGHLEGRFDETHLVGTLLTIAVFSPLCRSWSRQEV